MNKALETIRKNAWTWIPSIYVAEGLPYILINVVMVTVYQDLGVAEKVIPLYVGFFGYAWIFKPAWSPLVDLFRTKRWWILFTQAVLGTGFMLLGFILADEPFFTYSLVLLMWLSIVSATQDIAIDGHYMLALKENQQSFFVGIRSTFYRLAVLIGKGPLLILAGGLITTGGMSPYTAWSYTFIGIGAVFGILFLYHLIVVPEPERGGVVYKDEIEDKISLIGGEDTEKESESAKADVQQPLAKRQGNFLDVLKTFFQKPDIGIMIAFLLLYRLGESQLQSVGILFIKDDVAKGGLGLSTEEFGLVYGTYGTLALVAGGILGGILISRDGLKRWLWPMAIAINLPNVVYILLAVLQPGDSILTIACVVLEQFGYGFGFTAFMMYMIYVAQGPYKTAHYAFATAFMAIGMTFPMQASGYILGELGYMNFFIWASIATIASFFVTSLIKVPEGFGRKKGES
ncbi:MAG: MFS transporter [Bacteroidota bacterium]